MLWNLLKPRLLHKPTQHDAAADIALPDLYNRDLSYSSAALTYCGTS